MAESTSSRDTEVIDPDLLGILRCPLSHSELVLRGQELWCFESRKAYPIVNGIPVMLIEEARDLEPSEIA